MRVECAAVAVATLLLAGGSASVAGRGGGAANMVEELNERLRTGRAQLRFDERSGYLRSLLDVLQVPPESQVVTFSQASLHGTRVTAESPRAIFFSDAVSVAWTPQSATLELATASRGGTLQFYTMEQTPRQRPQFEERRECLVCHRSERTLDVPGLLMLSASRTSATMGVATDHRTPLTERWGGWFVTGLSRRWKHQGNRVGQGWLASLYDQFDTTGYPTLHSDIVALMVLEHQTRAANLIRRVHSLVQAAPGGPEASAATTELADYLLFVDEAPLPAKVVGTSGFTEWFSKRFPRAPSGRSLFVLDLTRRLFRYPVSYMIYSDQFDALPQPVKNAVYARIRHVLTTPVRQDRYPRLSATERIETLDVLTSTKPDFERSGL